MKKLFLIPVFMLVIFGCDSATYVEEEAFLSLEEEKNVLDDKIESLDERILFLENQNERYKEMLELLLEHYDEDFENSENIRESVEIEWGEVYTDTLYGSFDKTRYSFELNSPATVTGYIFTESTLDVNIFEYNDYTTFIEITDLLEETSFSYHFDEGEHGIEIENWDGHSRVSYSIKFEVDYPSLKGD